MKSNPALGPSLHDRSMSAPRIERRPRLTSRSLRMGDSLCTIDSFDGSLEALRREWPEHLTRDADRDAEMADRLDAVRRLQEQAREAIIRRVVAVVLALSVAAAIWAF